MLKNDQTDFKDLAVLASQDFKSMFAHFFNTMHEKINHPSPSLRKYYHYINFIYCKTLDSALHC